MSDVLGDGVVPTPPIGLVPIVAPPLPHATSDATPIESVKSVMERRTLEKSRTLNTHDRFDESAREGRAEAGRFVETGPRALRARCEDARGISVWPALRL